MTYPNELNQHLCAPISQMTDMARSPNPSCRLRAIRIAPYYAERFPDAVVGVFRLLLRDPVKQIRRSARSGLGECLEAMGGMVRLQTLMDWTSSDRSRERETMAESLSQHGAMIGCADAVAMLAADECRRVRKAAAKTASSLLDTAGLRYLPILQSLCADSSRSIRRLAIQRLRRARIGLVPSDPSPVRHFRGNIFGGPRAA